MTNLPPTLAAVVAWPIAADCDFDHPYCERDDSAWHNGVPGAFEFDDDAARAVADAIDGIVVWCPRHDVPGAWSLAVYPDPRNTEEAAR